MISIFTVASYLLTDLPTEREMDIWAELQATKDTLRLTEDEVTSCKREKVRFLETLTRITVNITLYLVWLLQKIKVIPGVYFLFQSYIPANFFPPPVR